MGHHHHGHAHGHHHHGHHHHFEEHREGNKKGLIIALAITAGIMFLEFFGGLFTNSLALLSDSGHMLSDTSSLLLSLIAMGFATRAATSKKTYGFYRFEVLAALFNGITLFLIAGFIIWEAYHRLFDPPTVASGSMMLIASVGLIANLISAWSLMSKGDVKNNINLRSAYLHVLGDALGSLGAILAGLLMWLFSWHIADPIISAIVAVLILKSAWGVIKHSIHILMEGTPSEINMKEIKEEVEKIKGVTNIHDLHVWTITSGLNALSCHVLIKENNDNQEVLQSIINKLKEKFHIEHATIQIETSEIQHAVMKV
ncbi:cation diffusion facilitator family transporter [Bacillus cereus]|uniref:cation diffusion facilitator family transporter n=1 Tax=Bacillus cereus TaxID=1396 RepID=UPI000BED36A1|nr:cation diffusion facilitator family transporter [Bacillus cereus]PEF61677.1 cation transporter [Bacillus cereus]